MVDLYFRDQIVKALDTAINEVNRDSFNLSLSDQTSIMLKIENVKKYVFDIYALKSATDEIEK